MHILDFVSSVLLLIAGILGVRKASLDLQITKLKLKSETEDQDKGGE